VINAGYYQIEDAIKWGLLMKVIGWGIYLMVVVRFYWSLIGLEIFVK
jgi:sodium-dependent dicarboxylate transporter 2/3/5